MKYAIQFKEDSSGAILWGQRLHHALRALHELLIYLDKLSRSKDEDQRDFAVSTQVCSSLTFSLLSYFLHSAPSLVTRSLLLAPSHLTGLLLALSSFNGSSPEYHTRAVKTTHIWAHAKNFPGLTHALRLHPFGANSVTLSASTHQVCKPQTHFNCSLQYLSDVNVTSGAMLRRRTFSTSSNSSRRCLVSRRVLRLPSSAWHSCVTSSSPTIWC